VELQGEGEKKLLFLSLRGIYGTPPPPEGKTITLQTGEVTKGCRIWALSQMRGRRVIIAGVERELLPMSARAEGMKQS